MCHGACDLGSFVRRQATKQVRPDSGFVGFAIRGQGFSQINQPGAFAGLKFQIWPARGSQRLLDAISRRLVIFPAEGKRRHECRRGTQECVRHIIGIGWRLAPQPNSDRSGDPFLYRPELRMHSSMQWRSFVRIRIARFRSSPSLIFSAAAMSFR